VAGLELKRILVVCIGNICRSPVAAQLMQQAFALSEVRSAGLAPAQGKDVHPFSRQIALDNELHLPLHSARRLTAEDCRWADIILVMERRHLGMVHNIAPYCRGKTFLFGMPCGNAEVPDPYGEQLPVFRATHALLKQCADAWRTMA